MKSAKPLRLFRIWDIILLAVILALLGAGLFLYFASSEGDYAEIYIDGEKYMTLSLKKDREVDLDALTVVVRNGAVHVEDPACKDKICEKRGEIRKSGESIVCAPARVVIRITGKKGEVEAIT